MRNLPAYLDHGALVVPMLNQIGFRATLKTWESAAGFAAWARGDFTIIAGSPYDDISATRDIAEVFVGGEALDRATMSARFQGLRQ